MKSKSLNRAHFEITHNSDAVSGLVMDRGTALKCSFFMPNGWEGGVMGIKEEKVIHLVEKREEKLSERAERIWQ